METILIVDDIEINRKLLRKMLDAMGEFKIVEAVNGVEAVEYVKGDEPDLILMDINMPDLNGLEATSAIKTHLGSRYVPIIIVTALSESVLSDALENGGDDFISKPFEYNVLASKIRAHLRIRELNQKLLSLNTELSDKNNHLEKEQSLVDHFFNNALTKSHLDENFIKYHMSSMSTFNGDVLLTQKSPNNSFFCLVGDFTGHGLSAAMGTLPVAMVFFKMVRVGCALSDIAAELNQQLHQLLPVEMFFAATIVEIPNNENYMSIWAGGMPECYVLDKGGEHKLTVNSKHMPLGILSKDEFDNSVEIINTSPGDGIYLYSDGLIESSNQAGEMYGNPRLLDKLTDARKTGKDVIRNIVADHREFVGRDQFEDDVTIVELTHSLDKTSDDNEDPVDTGSELSVPIPLEINIRLTHTELIAGDVVDSVVGVASGISELKAHKDTLNILLSEMLSNTIEHSILGMDSSIKDSPQGFESYYTEVKRRLSNSNNAEIFIKLKLVTEDKSRYLIISMSDNGTGYSEAMVTDDTSLYGRGLMIISSLTEKMHFSDDGSGVEIYYKLS